MTSSVRSIPPPPCHQSSSVRQPPLPPRWWRNMWMSPKTTETSFIRVAVGREWWAARDSWCERNCDDTTSVGWSHHDHCCRRVATTDRQHELAGALLTTSQTHTTQSLYTVSQKKTGPFSYEYNFLRYCPILIILSLLHTEIIRPPHKRVIEFATSPVVCCCITLKILLNRNCWINLQCMR